MRIVDFQERLERIDPEIKGKVELTLKCLFENSADFDEMTQILKTVKTIVKEQIKKVDTKKFK
jgi:hypothetical protein